MLMSKNVNNDVSKDSPIGSIERALSVLYPSEIRRDRLDRVETVPGG